VDLRKLEALKQVVEEGSFTLAARRLGRSQSRLSQQIRSLELEVGEPLLIRARPKVSATDAGQRILARAERVLMDVAAIKDQLEHSRRGEAAGRVRIAATPLAITYLYGRLLAHFIARYPAIEIVVHATETTQDPVTRVLEQSADVGFTVFPQSNARLSRLPMVKAEQVFIVGNKHPLAGEHTLPVQEIRRHSFVRFEHGTGQRMISDQVFHPGGYPPVLAESNEMEYVKRIVRMGLAVALVPVFCVRQELQDGTLRAIRARGGRIMQLAGVVSSKQAPSGSVATFLKACAELRGRSPRPITLESLARLPFEARI
jgi:DNA-binding transcriptional LysR family regulator